jgi:hypothetical protein
MNKFYCDCPESSVAAGVKVPDSVWGLEYERKCTDFVMDENTDFVMDENNEKIPIAEDNKGHIVTITQIFKDNRCKFCGSYAMVG